MILPDVNVLVEAGHRDAARHAASAAWLTAVLSGPGAVAVADVVLTGAVRVLTHRRIFADPAPPAVACSFVDAVRNAPAAVELTPTEATWRTFATLLRTDDLLRGNLVPDAWLAALALSHGAAVATRDRGFARFPGLKVVQPAV
jgi:toxin-antitoxin system PIN domain toxin